MPTLRKLVEALYEGIDEHWLERPENRDAIRTAEAVCRGEKLVATPEQPAAAEPEDG